MCVVASLCLFSLLNAPFLTEKHVWLLKRRKETFELDNINTCGQTQKENSDEFVWNTAANTLTRHVILSLTLASFHSVVSTSDTVYGGQRKHNKDTPLATVFDSVGSLLWITDKLLVSNIWFRLLCWSPMLKIKYRRKNSFLLLCAFLFFFIFFYTNCWPIETEC